MYKIYNKRTGQFMCEVETYDLANAEARHLSRTHFESYIIMLHSHVVGFVSYR